MDYSVRKQLVGLPAYNTHVGLWTQSLEQKRIDADNRLMNDRLAKAMKGGRYPGPKEAAEVMKKIEKIRSHKTKQRLQEEERNLRMVEKQNAIMLTGMARACQGGRIDNKWTDDFWRKNVVEAKHRKRIDAELVRRLLVADNARFCLKMLKDTESEYSRKAVQKDWPFKVYHMHYSSRIPGSEWWHEYLNELASMPPKRRLPPLTVKQQLDQVTERAHVEMEDNIAYYLTRGDSATLK